MMTDEFTLGLFAGLLSFTAISLSTFAIAGLVSAYRSRNYRPRHVRSTYIDPRSRKPKHKADV
jgi:hypothetical protein